MIDLENLIVKNDKGEFVFARDLEDINERLTKSMQILVQKALLDVIDAAMRLKVPLEHIECSYILNDEQYSLYYKDIQEHIKNGTNIQESSQIPEIR